MFILPIVILDHVRRHRIVEKDLSHSLDVTESVQAIFKRTHKLGKRSLSRAPDAVLKVRGLECNSMDKHGVWGAKSVSLQKK